MDMTAICPCPNAECPNHGYCDKCVSRHLKMGYLNFCGFETVVPVLEDAIRESPDSPTAVKLRQLIDGTRAVYAKLMEKNGITPEKQAELIASVKEVCSAGRE